MRKKRIDLRFAHFGRMANFMEEDVY